MPILSSLFPVKAACFHASSCFKPLCSEASGVALPPSESPPLFTLSFPSRCLWMLFKGSSSEDGELRPEQSWVENSERRSPCWFPRWSTNFRTTKQIKTLVLWVVVPFWPPSVLFPFAFSVSFHPEHMLPWSKGALSNLWPYACAWSAQGVFFHSLPSNLLPC